MNTTKMLIGAALAAMLTGCIPEPKDSPYTAVYAKMDTKEVSEYGTTQCTVAKIVRIGHTMGKSETMYAKCTATLTAGIDISSGNYNIEVDGKKVILRLPHATIMEPIHMDIDGISIEYPQSALQNAALTAAERMEILHEAERQILADQRIAGQMASQAETNAAPLYRAMLKSLGFKAIKIEFVP